MHHLTYSTLIKEYLTLIPLLIHIASQLNNLFLRIMNITSKHINLILPVHIYIFHNLFSPLLLHLLPIAQYLLSSLSEPLISLFDPSLR